MNIIKVEGIVINSISFKESSKILTIYTKEYGIIGVISKGCKSIKSKLRVFSDKYVYACFDISYKEGKLSTLIDGKIINYFSNIRKDINKLLYLTYICDLASGVYKESNNEEIYLLMISSLLKIENNINPRVITNILELKYLDYLGIGINMDGCVLCLSSNVSTISINKGGFICKNCITDEHIYDEIIIKTLRNYYHVNIDKISDIKINDDVINTIDNIINSYYEQYSGVKPKSKKYIYEFL